MNVPVRANELEFPMGRLKHLIVPKALSTNEPVLHRYFHRAGDEKAGKISYTREIQVHVQSHLVNVVNDVIRSCNYSLKTDTEAALNGLKGDIGILRNRNGDICGTMEVKQPQRQNATPPDPDPMRHAKVVTQVCSQMMPLRTMYGVKNVYGILSTYSSWRFFKWVPDGDDVEEAGQMLGDLQVSPSATDSLTTPRKTCDSDADQSEEDDNKEEDTGECKPGTLYSSDVISDKTLALKMLAWVLGEMDRTPIEHLPAHKRDFLYVVRKSAMGGYEKLQHDTDFYKGRMPNSSNGKLYMLEELGHRYHGRVFRTMSKNGNLCVLKYFVRVSQWLLRTVSG